jgi:hypothetical protein
MSALQRKTVTLNDMGNSPMRNEGKVLESKGCWSCSLQIFRIQFQGAVTSFASGIMGDVCPTMTLSVRPSSALAFLHWLLV